MFLRAVGYLYNGWTTLQYCSYGIFIPFMVFLLQRMRFKIVFSITSNSAHDVEKPCSCSRGCVCAFGDSVGHL